MQRHRRELEVAIRQSSKRWWEGGHGEWPASMTLQHMPCSLFNTGMSHMEQEKRMGQDMRGLEACLERHYRTTHEGTGSMQ